VGIFYDYTCVFNNLNYNEAIEVMNYLTRFDIIFLISKKLTKITFNVVYSGIAIIKPKMPKRIPENIITIKTSRGCDFTEDENI
jgi:hypothetical protein